MTRKQRKLKLKKARSHKLSIWLADVERQNKRDYWHRITDHSQEFFSDRNIGNY